MDSEVLQLGHHRGRRKTGDKDLPAIDLDRAILPGVVHLQDAPTQPVNS